MPKQLLMHPDMLSALAQAIAQSVYQALAPPQRSIVDPTEMPPTVRVMLELRTTALQAALQVEHDRERVLETAQRFLVFLQQGV
jgi:hypothetical protein